MCRIIPHITVEVKRFIVVIVCRILVVPRFYLLLICFYSSCFQDSLNFTDDYSVPKATNNKGKADQYLHSLNMLNDSKNTSYFIVSVPHE